MDDFVAFERRTGNILRDKIYGSMWHVTTSINSGKFPASSALFTLLCTFQFFFSVPRSRKPDRRPIWRRCRLCIGPLKKILRHNQDVLYSETKFLRRQISRISAFTLLFRMGSVAQVDCRFFRDKCIFARIARISDCFIKLWWGSVNELTKVRIRNCRTLKTVSH